VTKKNPRKGGDALRNYVGSFLGSWISFLTLLRFVQKTSVE